MGNNVARPRNNISAPGISYDKVAHDFPDMSQVNLGLKNPGDVSWKALDRNDDVHVGFGLVKEIHGSEIISALFCLQKTGSLGEIFFFAAECDAKTRDKHERPS